MSIRWLEADWPAPPGGRGVSPCRTGGVSGGRYASLNLGDHVGDDASAVSANRRLLTSAATLPAAPSWLSQVHGINVADLDSPPREPADGAYSRRADTVC